MANFFSCFYIYDFLNFENSSELGKWLMKSIHINLGIRTRKRILANKSKEEKALFLDFFDERSPSSKEAKTSEFKATEWTHISIRPPPNKVAVPVHNRTAGDAQKVEGSERPDLDNMTQDQCDRYFVEKHGYHRDTDNVFGGYGDNASYESPTPGHGARAQLQGDLRNFVATNFIQSVVDDTIRRGGQ